MGLDALLQNQFGHTYTPFPPQRVKIELISTLGAAVSEIRADFQNSKTVWVCGSGQATTEI